MDAYSWNFTLFLKVFRNSMPTHSNRGQSLSASKRSWILIVLCGVTSAILCAAPLRLPLGKYSVSYVGTVYGLLLALYFVLCRGASSLKALSLIVASSAAYVIAFSGAMLLPTLLPTLPWGLDFFDSGEPTAMLFIAGGVLGGAVLVPAVVLLSKTRLQTWTSTIGKVIGGILLSGFLGALAFVLSRSLGKLVWTLIPIEPLPTNDSYVMAAIFMAWQPTMAVFFAWATTSKVQQVDAPTIADSSTVIPDESPPALPSRGTFLIASIVLIAICLARLTPLWIHATGRELAIAKKDRTRPAVDGLPDLNPNQKEDVLILKEIAGYEPRQTADEVHYGSHEKGGQHPGSHYYAATYFKSGDADRTPTGPAPKIYVSVEQYPTAEWAQYLAEYPQNIALLFDNPKQHAVVTKLNAKMRTNQLEQPAGVHWFSVYYMWPSGPYVVWVQGYTLDENVEFLRPYLTKYPSSIK